MKNKLYFLSSGLLISSILVGCGPGESSDGESAAQEDSEGATLVVWEDIDKSAGTEAAIAAFEEEHDVTVEVIERPYGDNVEDLRLDGPGGTGPDVFAMPHDSIGTAVTEGLIKPLDVSQEVQDMYTESAMLSQMVDGEVYGLPYAVETTLLYYNRDLVDEENLPTTLDEWYEFSENITGDGTYGFLALWDQIYYAQSIIGGYGGYIFAQDDEGNYDVEDIGLNNEGAIEAAEYIQKFYSEGLFPSGIIGEQGINVLDSLFSEGKAAAVISGPWNLGPYEQAGIDYGVVPLPQLSNGDPMSSFVGVKSYNVSSYSEYPELAQELVLWLTNEENQLTRYENTQEVPAIKALEDNPVITESDSTQAIFEQSGNSVLMPGIPEMSEVWTPADSALQTIATGSAEPEEALNGAAEAIRNQIEANHSGN
ncbi:sugar ABC transporter substrate-binding protein [Marinilactibacillus piezotolerans]|uniref:sugar ABC transporter substrate-binding protein n=1 Tax=Marinilactibacillus piezotolerans TaxID=258723 RepID=UPI00117DD0B6|nr:extracellular solute-binding protein [Marinilactibacillus piezotolerans]